MTEQLVIGEEARPKKAERVWHTADLNDAIRQRFPAPEWSLFFEVRSAAGFDGRRTADAIAMNTWPSRGMEIHGFEVKQDRRDWQREMKDPAKAEALMKFCDRWWLVAAPGIVHHGELPPTWGLLEPRGKALVVKVEAPKLEAAPLTRSFVAVLMRNAAESNASEQQIAAAIARSRESFKGEVDEAFEKGRRETARAHADLQASVAEFERNSGLKIDRYGGHRLGDAVRLVMEIGPARLRQELEYERNRHITAAQNIEHAIAAYDERAKTVATEKGGA